MHAKLLTGVAGVALLTLGVILSGTRAQSPPDSEPADAAIGGPHPADRAAGSPAGPPPQPGSASPPRPVVLEAVDVDHDGQISDAELIGSSKALQALDKDGDRQLAGDELQPSFRDGPFGGPGGRGPFGGGERKLVKQFDGNGDGRLDVKERATARKANTEDRPTGGPRGFGPRPAGSGREAPRPGPRIAPPDVEQHPGAPLYDPAVLRTLFLEFEGDDWEAELAEFKGTDVEVPAKLVVDGREYPGVGVHFRGMSSFMMVPAGYKRSLNVSLDFTDPGQRLYGYKTLNLLNANGDPSFLSSALYSHVARKYIPAPKANLVRVVINGECWGVYSNVQQFDKVFLAENFKTTEGVRWKVSGSPGGGGGLEYLGEEIDKYKQRFELKSKDGYRPWRDLINLCRALNETPAEKFEETLSPMVDVDGLLRFLALDVALCNSDGYWVRASDYNIYQDPAGVFHFLPHDMNEAFALESGRGPGGPGGPGRREGRDRRSEPLRDFGRPGEFASPDDLAEALGGFALRDFRPAGFGPGGGGPPGFGPGGPPGLGHGGVDLDPLVALDDPRKPLRSKVLAVPSLRAKYLQYVREIAEELDWGRLGPVVAGYRSLAERHVEADTRKLSTFEAFQQATADSPSEIGDSPASLRRFADQRRSYLLSYSPTEHSSAEQVAEGVTAEPSRRGGPQFSFGPPPFAFMRALDGDGDQSLSTEELERADQSLRSLDEDGDGKLVEREIGWPPFAGGGFGPSGFGPPGGGPGDFAAPDDRMEAQDRSDPALESDTQNRGAASPVDLGGQGQPTASFDRNAH